MPRGISWDTLPNQFDPYDKGSIKKKEDIVEPKVVQHPSERKFDLVEDLEAIARRGAFGAVVRTADN